MFQCDNVMRDHMIAKNRVVHEKTEVSIKDLGLIDYKKCWDYQEELFAEILATKSTNRKKNKTTKTCLMLSDDARSLVHTISSFQDCSQSEAVNLLMKFALDEYHASGGKLIELPKPKTKAK